MAVAGLATLEASVTVVTFPYSQVAKHPCSSLSKGNPSPYFEVEFPSFLVIRYPFPLNCL